METSISSLKQPKDLERMDPANPKYDRLLLNEERLQASPPTSAQGTSPPPAQPGAGRTHAAQWSGSASPHRASGRHRHHLRISTNVTFDVFALCLKSGNASVPGQPRRPLFQPTILRLIHQVLEPKLPAGCLLYLAPSEREPCPHPGSRWATSTYIPEAARADQLRAATRQDTGDRDRSGHRAHLLR